MQTEIYVGTSLFNLAFRRNTDNAVGDCDGVLACVDCCLTLLTHCLRASMRRQCSTAGNVTGGMAKDLVKFGPLGDGRIISFLYL